VRSTLRRPSPIGITNLLHQKDTAIALFRNGASINEVHSEKIRMTDLVSPYSTYGTPEAGLAHYAYRGLQTLAEKYKYHRVFKFGLSMKLTMRNTVSVDSVAIPDLYVAWRMTEDVPASVANGGLDGTSSALTVYDYIVSGQQCGWRFKRIKVGHDKTFSRTIRFSVPIQKISGVIEAPVSADQATIKGNYNVTDGSGIAGSQSAASPTTWTGPTNNTFVQIMIFTGRQSRFSAAAGVVGNSNFQISILKHQFLFAGVRSHDRLNVCQTKQVVTTVASADPALVYATDDHEETPFVPDPTAPGHIDYNENLDLE